jgi:hypothetical protein
MRVPQRDLVAFTGATVPVPDPELLVHLQFRRFAGCPVCNLHLRTVVTRHDEIRAASARWWCSTAAWPSCVGTSTTCRST